MDLRLRAPNCCRTSKARALRTCKLGPRRLEEETAWLERYRQLWDARFDALDKVVEELKRKEKVDGRKKETESPINNRTALERRLAAWPRGVEAGARRSPRDAAGS